MNPGFWILNFTESALIEKRTTNYNHYYDLLSIVAFWNNAKKHLTFKFFKNNIQNVQMLKYVPDHTCSLLGKHSFVDKELLLAAVLYIKTT